MPRILTDLAALALAVMGVWVVRRRGWRELWLGALLLACGLAIVAYYEPSLELVKGNANGFGSAGVHTQWYPAAVIAMAAVVHLSSWRRIPSFVGTVLGVLFAWLAWEVVTAYSFWIS